MQGYQRILDEILMAFDAAYQHSGKVFYCFSFNFAGEIGYARVNGGQHLHPLGGHYCRFVFRHNSKSSTSAPNNEPKMGKWVIST